MTIAHLMDAIHVVVFTSKIGVYLRDGMQAPSDM
jgi:hypothetical protein